jgi:3-methyladenine DNA glycosylase AlkD
MSRVAGRGVADGSTVVTTAGPTGPTQGGAAAPVHGDAPIYGVARPARDLSPITAAARAFVDEHLDEARAVGRAAADVIDDPDAVAATLDAGLRALADPAFEEGVRRVTPGIGEVLGVRTPLLDAVHGSLVRGLRGVSPARVLPVADRLFREAIPEAQWLAIRLLDRTLAADPERTWQLIRRAARHATEWITVDRLSEPCARGILREPYRWAELEQLVYSPSRWERRLVGSTIARMPFEAADGGREPTVAKRGLEVISTLIGDAEPDVQKALSWALRSLTLVDPAAVAAFCTREAELAARTDDGHRAWVLRDAATRIPAPDRATVTALLGSVRRRPGAPSTSEAAVEAAHFGIPVPPADLPEPPLT